MTIDRDKRVVVAMSGGVDSSVAAGLLVDAGMHVFGLTLALSPGGSEGDRRAVALARQAAAELGIEHRVVEGGSRFEQRVLRRCWDEYAAGRTPNPCALCNPAVKFRLLLDHADAMDADQVATGHHARAERADDGTMALRRGHDPAKDQSYFLARLHPQQLARTLFPVGRMTKDRVRQQADSRGLSCARQPESQDTCWALDDSGFAENLRAHFGGEVSEGEMVDPAGHVLGRHRGVHRYTVGQRRGLGVALGCRAYVLNVDARSNRVVLGTDPRALLSEGLEADDVRWLAEPLPARSESAPVSVQIRYRSAAVPARLRLLNGHRIRLRFDVPQRAVTPGQTAVVYRHDRVLCSGWIRHALPQSTILDE